MSCLGSFQGRSHGSLGFGLHFFRIPNSGLDQCGGDLANCPSKSFKKPQVVRKVSFNHRIECAEYKVLYFWLGFFLFLEICNPLMELPLSLLFFHNFFLLNLTTIFSLNYLISQASVGQIKKIIFF